MVNTNPWTTLAKKHGRTSAQTLQRSRHEPRLRRLELLLVPGDGIWQQRALWTPLLEPAEHQPVNANLTQGPHFDAYTAPIAETATT